MIGGLPSTGLVRSVLATWMALGALCSCAEDRPVAVYPTSAGIGALMGAIIGLAPKAVIGSAAGAAVLPLNLRVARATLYSDDEDNGQFGAFSYLIATLKDPDSPWGKGCTRRSKPMREKLPIVLQLG